MRIKAIETQYKGYRFRSRLEARWAVYLDSLNIKWEYEKEGYNLEDGTPYLPDFWLPEVEMWAEVKGTLFTEEELEKAILLHRGLGFPVLLLEGVPKCGVYLATTEGVKTKGGMDEYVLTNYHNYPKSEGRFYSMPSDEDFECGMFNDTEVATNKAKSARFEHGDNGVVSEDDDLGEGRVSFKERDLGPVTGWALTVSITKLAKDNNFKHCPNCGHEFQLQESHGLYFCKYCSKGGGLKKFAEMIAKKINQGAGIK